jgi:hypothetical protein
VKRDDDARKAPPDFEDATKVASFRTDPRGALLKTDLTVEELAMAEATKVCGQCRHFDLASGQQKMRAARFLEQLVHEYEWQVRHLAAPVNELGLCGAHSSGAGKEEHLTARLNPACEQFREDRGLVTLQRKAKL